MCFGHLVIHFGCASTGSNVIEAVRLSTKSPNNFNDDINIQNLDKPTRSTDSSQKIHQDHNEDGDNMPRQWMF